MNKKEEALLGNLSYREILNAIPADIAVFDPNHKYLFVNKNAVKDDMIREWIIGKDDFDYCRKFNKPISIAESRRSIFNEAINNGPGTLEEKVPGKQGEQYHLRHMVPIYDENNEVRFVIGYGVDITSIKQTQLDLEEAKRLSVVGEFAAGIAHEVNNPLAVILAKSQLLQLQVLQLSIPDNSKTRIYQTIDTINKTCLFTSELIRNLKSFSSKADFEHLEYISLLKTIGIALKLSGKRCENENIKIIIDVPPELTLLCNEVALGQVFMNLLTNSIDALKDLSDKWIKIETKTDGKILKICFTDSGKGIPDGISTRILQPFFTTKEPGSGTGLGLSISSKSVTKMGGKLYYNRKSINTQFIIEFKSFELGYELKKTNNSY
jgi:signal transduction histidine kinase